MSRHRLQSISVPAEIGGGATIWATSLNERHLPTGTTRHLGSDGSVVVVSALAICRVPGSSGAFLFYCSADWSPLADTWHESVDAAKAQAEFEFAGLGDSWVPVDAQGR